MVIQNDVVKKVPREVPAISRLAGATSFTPGGGCSCKASPDIVAAVSGAVQAGGTGDPPDDAAFILVEPSRVLLESIDFQNPLVDDYRIAGEIAAKNALSDIYASGAQPSGALGVLILPNDPHALEIGIEVMSGMADACAEAGCNIVGGHTITGPVPAFGLSVFALASADTIKKKSGARAGDMIVLTKPLGIGIAVAARQMGLISEIDFALAVRTARQSNSIGGILGTCPGVHALTDVTGYGLVGHACEVARASNVLLDIRFRDVPVLAGVGAAAREGAVPVLADATLRTVQADVLFHASLQAHERLILADPQTNGGLLACVDPAALPEVITKMIDSGLMPAVIGTVGPRDPQGILMRVSK